VSGTRYLSSSGSTLFPCPTLNRTCLSLFIELYRVRSVVVRSVADPDNFDADPDPTSEKKPDMDPDPALCKIL
jgi:hypothetical protein